MKTKQQEKLIETFLSAVEPELCGIYQELVLHLSGLGYYPKKQRSVIAFHCDRHNKQIAKIGFNRKGEPFFALRFSACRGYSERFGSIVRDVVSGGKYSEPACMRGEHSYCKGRAEKRMYTYEFPVGEKRYYCGAKALVIPGLNEGDVPEVKRLMDEEHRFLMEYEAQQGIESNPLSEKG